MKQRAHTHKEMSVKGKTLSCQAPVASAKTRLDTDSENQAEPVAKVQPKPVIKNTEVL